MSSSFNAAVGYIVDGFRKSPVGWLSHEQKCGLIEGVVILSIKKGKQDIRRPGNQGCPYVLLIAANL